MEVYSYLHDVELPRSYGDLSKFHHRPGAQDAAHHTLPAMDYTQDYYNEDIDRGDHVAVCVGKGKTLISSKISSKILHSTFGRNWKIFGWKI